MAGDAVDCKLVDGSAESSGGRGAAPGLCNSAKPSSLFCLDAVSARADRDPNIVLNKRNLNSTDTNIIGLWSLWNLSVVFNSKHR